MWILSRFQFNEKFTIYLVLNLIGTGNVPINWGYKPWKHRNPVPIPSLTSSTKPKSRSQSQSRRQKLSFYYSRIARMPNSLFTTLQQCKLCVRVFLPRTRKSCVHIDMLRTAHLGRCQAQLTHHRKICANILKQWVPVVTIASATSLCTTGGSSLHHSRS